MGFPAAIAEKPQTGTLSSGARLSETSVPNLVHTLPLMGKRTQQSASRSELFPTLAAKFDRLWEVDGFSQVQLSQVFEQLDDIRSPH